MNMRKHERQDLYMPLLPGLIFPVTVVILMSLLMYTKADEMRPDMKDAATVAVEQLETRATSKPGSLLQSLRSYQKCRPRPRPKNSSCLEQPKKLPEA